MSIPNITLSNPLSDALRDSTEEYLNPSNLYTPPVISPEDLRDGDNIINHNISFSNMPRGFR